MKSNIQYRHLTPADFDQVITLGNHVHGDGYLDQNNIKEWYEKGLKDEVNASFVAYDGQKLVGFRITFAPLTWDIDEWCTPEKWPFAKNTACYFKCNTVDGDYRGHGIGSALLKRSIETSIAQGAKFGVSHLWRQSPGNSAVKYFTKCGGKLIKDHPDRWNALSKAGYNCVICGHDCHCVAAEMMIQFDS